MKKYRVTDKHPELKEGIVFSQKYVSDDEYLSTSETLIIIESDIFKLIDKGWIKEIQKLEFTKDDLLSFGDYCAVCHLGSDSVEVDEMDFNKWKKENE